MRILIGTPIHICKDYAMERWLENVARVQERTPADLLLVDNSPGSGYVEKVKGYCAGLGMHSIRIEHFDFQSNDMDNAGSKRIEIAHELIRREALKGEYDAWFSWECDQIIPENALEELTRLMESEHYMMVMHNSWVRTNPNELNANMGCALIGKEALHRGWFLDIKNGEIDFNVSGRRVDETAFRRRVVQNGGNYMEAFGIIEPILHLNS